MTVSRSQIDLILSATKVVASGRRFRSKGHVDYYELVSEVACLDHPEFNFQYRCVYHCSRDPRKVSHLLTADNQRIFALDINPGGSHRNLITLESIYGTHWQIGPDMDAELDARDLTPLQWHYEFARRAGLEFNDYVAPTFNREVPVMSDLFGEEDA